MGDLLQERQHAVLKTDNWLAPDVPLAQEKATQALAELLAKFIQRWVNDANLDNERTSPYTTAAAVTQLNNYTRGDNPLMRRSDI